MPNKDQPLVSIIIANWNGEGLIRKCLSSALVSLRSASIPGEIIVIDDASSDSSTQIIRSEFPQARLIENPHNLGFISSINKAVDNARGSIVILLNNDIVVQSDFVHAITSHLIEDKDNKMFAVSAKTVSWSDNTPNHVLMTARFRRGKIQLQWDDHQNAQHTLFIQGGACAIRRNIFIKLGGFQPIFFPGYWEDYDISYIAAKHGLKSIYDPNSCAFHLGKSSMLQLLGKDGLSAVKKRNELIFTWINISNTAMLFQHFLLLPLNIFSDMWRSADFTSAKAVIFAITRLPGILRLRAIRKKFARLSDYKILLK